MCPEQKLVLHVTKAVGSDRFAVDHESSRTATLDDGYVGALSFLVVEHRTFACKGF